MWSAYVLANVGVWIQTVGAAWLMTTLTSDALPVALVQTATTLPALVIGLPAGSLGDRVDRRRLVLATQAWMVVSVTVLAGLTLLGLRRTPSDLRELQRGLRPEKTMSFAKSRG